MSGEPTRRLTRDELLALKLAAHSQLAKWVKSSHLRSRQLDHRAALLRAVRVLEDQALADGCELRADAAEGDDR